MKAKSSYQRMTEKYHHSVVELGLKDKKIKELEKSLYTCRKVIDEKSKEQPKDNNKAKPTRKYYKLTTTFIGLDGKQHSVYACPKCMDLAQAFNNVVDELDKLQEVEKELSEAYKTIDKLEGNEKLNDIGKPKDQPEPTDQYQVFRDAIKDGKTVQFQDGLNNWVDPDDESKQKWGFVYPPEDYRIKPESEPKPTDQYQVFRDAIKEGKTVQYYVDGEWTESLREWAFDRHHSCYRIKHEPEPTPFAKMPHDSLINQVISNNASGELLVITRVRKDTVVAGNIEIKYDHLFKYYSLHSGGVCGKQK